MALLFNILFFLIPLVFFKTTSELFEFNKIITLYVFTTLIVSVWIINSIKQRKFIFRRTILDIPLTLYLFILLLSTLFSIDPRTSVLGYYSRFNGGLLSQVCYALLYWAFVSNLNKKQSLHTIYYTLASIALASLLAFLEHFGIFATCGLMNLGWRESCWVQDVQSRVFSTLGQPNWLAALLVALIPISWAYSLRHKRSLPQGGKPYSILSILFFVTLLFTGSRSGLLAFGVESILFWGFIFWKYKFKYIKELLILNFSFLVLFFVFSSPITKSNPLRGHQLPVTVSEGPALEVGGTESGTIRKYVWLGAINVFKHYPILGTGPETFAFSFPMFKPVEHNLTSEWDFVYNKAHNEYLNFLANTGAIGLLSYFIIIIFSILQITNYTNYSKYSKLENFKNYLGQLGKLEQLEIGLLAGYVAILITNFFGFSVVPVSLLFFLFPAMIAVRFMPNVVWEKQKKLTLNQKALVLLVLITAYSILHITYSYWRADIYYNKAKLFNKSGNLPMAKQEISKSLKISPNEPLYLNELSIAENSVEISQNAFLLSPYNINLVRSLAGIYSRNNNPKKAIEVLQSFLVKTPNDPKLYYQIGVYLIKLSNLEKAKLVFIKSIELKPNYKDARFALGLTYIDLKEFDLAKKELEYILEFIDSKDELTKKYLNELQ